MSEVGLMASEPKEQEAVLIERGVCHVLFAYDVGLSIALDEAERRTTDYTVRGTIKRKRRAPEYFQYDPPPLRVTQTAEPIALGDYHTSATVEVLVYDFGAACVTYDIPLSGPLAGLLDLSNRLYDNALLLADSRRRIEQLVGIIRSAINKPGISNLVEDYATYELAALSGGLGPEPLLASHGSLLARILRAEVEPLSEQEVKDALACRTAFGSNDLVIADWNAAIVIDTDAEDVRAVLEFANVELLEMRFLDDRLDDALEESYAALARRAWGSWRVFAPPRDDLRRVAELQVDAALLFEGVNNALKLLGDQYLARVYRAMSQRLHLSDWDGSIIRKLQTLESIYHKMADHHAKVRMEVLEWIIIILIALSIVVSFVPGLTGH